MLQTSVYELITTKEAGLLLGISPRRVVALIHQARLPAFKLSRDWLIDPAHLALVEKRRPGCPPGTKRKKARSYNEPTPAMKEFIFERDGRCCQYCGTEQAESYVVEHILPRGLAFPGNLCISCRSCNTKKKREIWIPRNFYVITQDYQLWQAQLLQQASRNFSRGDQAAACQPAS